jgi:hypothetical protein
LENDDGRLISRFQIQNPILEADVPSFKYHLNDNN